jgi:hypothetical protein
MRTWDAVRIVKSRYFLLYVAYSLTFLQTLPCSGNDFSSPPPPSDTGCCGRGWHGNQPMWRLRPEKRETAPAIVWHFTVLFRLSFHRLPPYVMGDTCSRCEVDGKFVDILVRNRSLLWVRRQGKRERHMYWLEFLVGFQSSSRRRPGVVSQLDHRFLPNPFQFHSSLILLGNSEYLKTETPWPESANEHIFRVTAACRRS